MHDFKAVLDSRRDAQAFRKSAPQVGKEKKIMKMGYCIREGYWDLLRDFAATAVCTSIQEDVGQNRSFVSFHMMGGKDGLDRVSGLFGMMKDPGTTAFDLSDSTIEILKTFCTRRAYSPNDKPGTFDEQLWQKISENIQMMAADAATNCNKAARLLRSAQLPFMRRLKDKCHAMGRVLSKPTRADAFLAEVFHTLIEHEESIPNLLKWGPDLQRIFSKMCKQCESSPLNAARIRAMGYAKQRYNSKSKPSARIVLWFDACVAFCIEVQLVRTGKATSGAKRFLAFITEERYLTLAMLADAFDEAMLLVRLFEQGDYDAAEILSTIQTYVENLDVLFLQKKAKYCGYTRFALELLKTQRVFLVGQGRKIFGGPHVITDAIYDRCCARMCAYMRLVLSALDAEFGDWQLLFAFAPFDLSRGAASKVRRISITEFQTAEECHNKHFTRLALCHAPMNVEALTDQHSWLLSRARQEYDLRGHLSGDRSFQSWVASARWATGISKASNRPLGVLTELKEILQSYGIFCGATSSISERLIGTTEWIFGDYRHCSPGRELDDVVLSTVDCEKFSVDDICKAAQRVWRESFGAPRTVTGCGKRFRKPSKHQRLDTEIGFCRKRRAEVAELSKNSSKRSRAALDNALREETSSPGIWTDSHEMASRKLAQIEVGEYVNALGEGSLLPEERLPEIVQLYEEQQRRQAKADRAALSRNIKVATQVTPKGKMNLQNLKIHFVDDVQQPRELMRSHNMHVMESGLILETQHFIVSDLRHISLETHWAATLTGASISALAFLTSGRGRVVVREQ